MKETISVYRNEIKYLLSNEEVANIKFTLNKILLKDNNIKDNSYKVRSLYFDSINNIDFNTKLSGNEIRKKIRIRSYNIKDNKCKIEMKQKNGNYQHKISFWINKNDVNELIKSNYYVLKKYFKNNKDAVLIYETMILGHYKPVVMVEYDRIAYTYPLYNTRITLDFNIKSSETNFNLFDKNIIYTPIFIKNTILEIKYNEKLMDFISNTLKQYNLTQLSISKYCSSRIVFYDFNY